MLKDKEVVADPQRQYEIARRVHATQHGGINKTTAHIAEKYHWVRIKETVSLVIKNCPDCKDTTKAPVVRPTTAASADNAALMASNGGGPMARRVAAPTDPNSMIERLVNFDELQTTADHRDYTHMPLDPQILEAEVTGAAGAVGEMSGGGSAGDMIGVMNGDGDGAAGGGGRRRREGAMMEMMNSTENLPRGDEIIMAVEDSISANRGGMTTDPSAAPAADLVIDPTLHPGHFLADPRMPLPPCPPPTTTTDAVWNAGRDLR